MQKYRESFAVSELGRIYAQLPLKEMAEKIRSHFCEKASSCAESGVLFFRTYALSKDLYLFSPGMFCGSGEMG